MKKVLTLLAFRGVLPPGAFHSHHTDFLPDMITPGGRKGLYTDTAPKWPACGLERRGEVTSAFLNLNPTSRIHRPRLHQVGGAPRDAAEEERRFALQRPRVSHPPTQHPPTYPPTNQFATCDALGTSQCMAHDAI